MSALDWKRAEEKLSRLTAIFQKVDIYVVLNMLAPLRTRFYNGERSARLYNEIMSLQLERVSKTAKTYNP